MNKNQHKKLLFFVVILALFISIICSILFGAVSLSISDFMTAILDNISKQHTIIFNIRIPRTLGAIIAGIGFAVSGAIIQMVFHNPLASPNIIGVNSGASFAVILASIFFPSTYYMLPISAFCGALFTALLIFTIGKNTGLSKTSLVLSGLAINSLFTSATDLICNLNDSFIVSNKNFRMGSLATIDANVLRLASLLILISFLLILLLHNELEMLSLGYETATTLGLPVAKFRLVFLILAALLAGAAISFAGPIGFVGLIVPHIVRLLGLSETKEYLIASALMGALLICICDLVGRMLFRPHELPVGIILSLLGVPFFLWLLIRRRKQTIA